MSGSEVEHPYSQRNDDEAFNMEVESHYDAEMESVLNSGQNHKSNRKSQKQRKQV
jgi:hypothetical protein